MLSTHATENVPQHTGNSQRNPVHITNLANIPDNFRPLVNLFACSKDETPRPQQSLALFHDSTLKQRCIPSFEDILCLLASCTEEGSASNGGSSYRSQPPPQPTTPPALGVSCQDGVPTPALQRICRYAAERKFYPPRQPGTTAKSSSGSIDNSTNAFGSELTGSGVNEQQQPQKQGIYNPSSQDASQRPLLRPLASVLCRQGSCRGMAFFVADGQGEVNRSSARQFEVLSAALCYHAAV